MIRAALLSAVFSLAVAVPVWAATVTDFAKTFTVTVPAGFADEPLSDFPLLVRLESGIQGFKYADFRQNGADLLVTDTEDHPLPIELENWDTGGVSRLWVQVPSVAEGTTIRVYYGSNATVDEVDGMWDGYAAVWHLNEAGDGAVDIFDSTTNHLDGVAASGNKGSLAVAGGQLGGARRIAQDNEHAPGIVIPATSGAQKDAADRLGTDFHASFWLRSRSEKEDFSDLKWGNIIGRRKGDQGTSWGFAFHGDSNDANQSTYMRVFAGSTKITTTKGTIGENLRESASETWKKVDVVWQYASNGNSPVAVVYTNGVPAETVTLPEAVALQNANIGIGCSTQDQYGSDNNNKKGRRLNGEMDEVRLRYGASSAARIAAEYRQESGTLTAVCGEVGLVDAGAPTVSAPSIVRNADGTFTVSIVVSENDAASVTCLVGNAEFAMTSADPTLPKTYAATLSGLASDTTFTYAVQAMSTGGDMLNRSGAETFHTGDLTVAKVQDGDEDGLVPGVFRISRAANGAMALPVSFTLGGTAVEGRSYRTMPRTATIPADAAYVDVEILPLIDPVLETAATVELSLAPGLYGISATNGAATLSIAKLTFDDTKNTWIAAEAGSATNAANWSFGHAPLATEHVLFDGRFSNADCEWPVEATHTVAAWTQDNGYTGTVMVCTVFPGKGDFTCLTVTGALTVDAGFLTHPQSRDRTDNVRSSQGFDFLADLLENETYRLRIDAGSLHVGADGVLDARGKGYLLSGDSSQCATCSHGGRMNADSPRCYGDPREPVHIGLPHRFYTNKQNNGAGGGAIYVTVRGAAVVDGTIRADPWDVSEANDSGKYVGAFGAAGSIFLRADTLTGCGRITADGLGQSDYGIVPTVGNPENNFKGTGGRVAIVTRVPVDRSTFAAISAEGRWMGAAGASWTARFGGGSGTVVFRDETRPNGLLVIAQDAAAVAPTLLGDSFPTFWRCPSVTAEGDWTFDAIEFGHRGFLVVPVGTTLALPGGLASCYGTAASADTCGGIRYEGGTIDAGVGDQTLSGNWMFVPWSNYVFSAGVVVTNGAAIGFHPVTDVLDDPSVTPLFPSASFEVSGDMLVGADAAIRAIDCGVVSTNKTSDLLLGQHSHGGRSIYLGRDASGALVSKAYDSVFAPRLPGSTAGAGLGVGATSKTQRSGGAVRMVVGGTLTLDGEATVSGQPEDRDKNGNYGNRTGGAGGSLDITAARLAGAGTMRANGGNYNEFSGPGGRIAVRLTASGADFTAFTGRIEAGGGSWRKGGAIDPTPDASAGTVYLETAADGDKGGIVRIAMDPVNAKYIKDRIKGNSPANTNTTEMVSLGYGGDDIKAYKKVRYIIENYGRAAVNTDFRAQSVTLADGTAALDLEGHTLTLRDFFWVTDSGAVTNKLRSGTYSCATLQPLVGECVMDTGEGGSVVILQNNLIIRLR